MPFGWDFPLNFEYEFSEKILSQVRYFLFYGQMHAIVTQNILCFEYELQLINKIKYAFGKNSVIIEHIHTNETLFEQHRISSHSSKNAESTNLPIHTCCHSTKRVARLPFVSRAMHTYVPLRPRKPPEAAFLVPTFFGTRRRRHPPAPVAPPKHPTPVASLAYTYHDCKLFSQLVAGVYVTSCFIFAQNTERRHTAGLAGTQKNEHTKDTNDTNAQNAYTAATCRRLRVGPMPSAASAISKRRTCVHALNTRIRCELIKVLRAT